MSTSIGFIGDWMLGRVVDCYALPNDHMLDFEVPALEDTLDALDDSSIERVGAGRIEDEALDPGVVTAGEHRIAVVSLTDKTPEIAADEYTPGTVSVNANPDCPNTATRRGGTDMGPRRGPGHARRVRPPGPEHGRDHALWGR